MPDPKTLEVGDRVRFIVLPDEWSLPGYFVHPESRAFMRKMIDRRHAPVSVRSTKMELHGSKRDFEFAEKSTTIRGTSQRRPVCA